MDISSLWLLTASLFLCIICNARPELYHRKIVELEEVNEQRNERTSATNLKQAWVADSATPKVLYQEGALQHGAGYQQWQGSIIQQKSDASCEKGIDVFVHMSSKHRPMDKDSSLQCGVPVVMPTITLRIFGGREARSGSYPWQVSLRERIGRTAKCGGSLLSKKWVLTAAHCFVKSAEPDYFVGFLGKHNEKRKEKEEISITFSKVVIHEKYILEQNIYDIAMMKIDAPIDYKENIRPICLPPPKLVLHSGEILHVTGWGISRNGKETLLQQADVEYISNKKCKEFLPNRAPILDSMLCAGYEQGGKDACRGDSGGPLIRLNEERKFEQVGIVSWGYGCGERQRPGVYTRVSSFVQWIQMVTAEHRDGSFPSGNRKPEHHNQKTLIKSTLY